MNNKIDRNSVISQLNSIFAPCVVGSVNINQRNQTLYFSLFDPSEDITLTMLENLSKFIDSKQININFKEYCGCDSGSQGSTKYIYLDCSQVNFKSLTYLYDPNLGDNVLCKCGHPYYRHFDTYNNMAPIGCKYAYLCHCENFEKSVDKKPKQILFR